MKQRIVVETSSDNREALEGALELHGETFREWFESQLELSLPEVIDRSIYNPANATSIDEIFDREKTKHKLNQVDWSFSDANTGYLTHDIHPYPAKFIPQIPAELIARLSLNGDIVFDPFGGSGTSATEAARLGRRAICLDANPIALLIARVKTGHLTPESCDELDGLVAAINSNLLAAPLKSSRWAEELRLSNQAWCPDIPNLEKWFSTTVIGELSLLRHLIESKTRAFSKDVALVALSRIVVRVSNQDSETRYVAKQKAIAPSNTLRAYVDSLHTIRRKLERSARYLQYADVRFLQGDTRKDIFSLVPGNSVGLIVTSPPYPNATDYHLYHRFRIFWLGDDPRNLASIEIGSHLKHQREQSGFDAYCSDLEQCLYGCIYVLQPGRYAAIVVGDAVFKGHSFDTAASLVEIAENVGFEHVDTIERQLPSNKRSFAKPARRARMEKIVILRKPDSTLRIKVLPPKYKMWDYEKDLRRLEIKAIVGSDYDANNTKGVVAYDITGEKLRDCSRLCFTSEIEFKDQLKIPTWQKVLENGASDDKNRKEPKYATHGLHNYKGKFYPQLAKSIINISGVPIGSNVLDPFCGSGTVTLECYLNGYKGFGIDMNPLAAKIASAKSDILRVDWVVVDQAIRSLINDVRSVSLPLPEAFDQFPDQLEQELLRWFPRKVLSKLNWLLAQIRLLGDNTLVDFLEVLVSSIIREISQQEPSDLRIRRRATEIEDAPVFELFLERLTTQQLRLIQFWQIAGRMPACPLSPKIVQGDARETLSFEELEIGEETIDAVVTSPPYATALPYIDTDRLSLLAVMGLDRKIRATLERELIGSREISRKERNDFEDAIASRMEEQLPVSVIQSIDEISSRNAKASVGFRRQNMPALLCRYFVGMRSVLDRVYWCLKPRGSAYFVVGDSRTQAGDEWYEIKTGALLCDVAAQCGFNTSRLLDITVTTENMRHIKNAITQNAIFKFEKN